MSENYIEKKEYHLIQKLGQGLLTKVYQAIDIETQQQVAIRIIDLDSSEIESIRKQLAILREIDSEHIVQYHGSLIKPNNQLWIVNELMSGGSVYDLLSINGLFSEPLIATVIREVLLAFLYLQKNNLIHRNVKASSMLLSLNGNIKLSDSLITSSVGLTDETVRGRNTYFTSTPYWLAPEMIENVEYTNSADIWSLGISLATGSPPLSNIHPIHAIFMIPKSDPPRLEGDKFSKTMKDFVSRCLQKKPKDRATVNELLHHKFIKSAGGLNLIADLINECSKFKEHKETKNIDIDFDLISLQNRPKHRTTRSRDSSTLSDDWSFDDTNDKIKAGTPEKETNTLNTPSGNRRKQSKSLISTGSYDISLTSPFIEQHSRNLSRDIDTDGFITITEASTPPSNNSQRTFPPYSQRKSISQLQFMETPQVTTSSRIEQGKEEVTEPFASERDELIEEEPFREIKEENLFSLSSDKDNEELLSQQINWELLRANLRLLFHKSSQQILQRFTFKTDLNIHFNRHMLFQEVISPVFAKLALNAGYQTPVYNNLLAIHEQLLDLEEHSPGMVKNLLTICASHCFRGDKI